jgi:hypothetical protein
MASLEAEFKEQMRQAREHLRKQAPEPTRPNGLSEDDWERLVFETTPVGLLEMWVARLAKEVDELRASRAGGNGDC